jgi:hypothetical protein
MVIIGDSVSTGHSLEATEEAGARRIHHWQTLAAALREVGTSNEVSANVQSAYGIRYVVDGALDTPSNRAARVRTVWIFEPNNAGPRLPSNFLLSQLQPAPTVHCKTRGSRHVALAIAAKSRARSIWTASIDRRRRGKLYAIKAP